MRLRCFPVLLLLVAGLLGCPESAPESSNNLVPSETNNVSNNSTAANNVNSDSNGTTATNNVVVELVPVEWGLFGGPAGGGDVVDARPGADGIATATIDVGPGAFALRVLEDNAMIIDATSSTADRLIPVAGNIGEQAFFLPARTTLELDVDTTTDVVTARVVNDGPDLPLDDPGALEEAGQWFDQMFGDIVAASDPGAATVELMSELRERGGPISTDQGVLFIAPARDGETPPQIRGTWNNFEWDPASELHRITPGFWARFIDVGPGRQEYKLYYPDGDVWFRDAANPHVDWDGFDPGTVGDFNSVIAPSGSRTVWMADVASSQLQNERDVFVHLPSTYDTSTDAYPSLYVHDGNESIVRSQFHIIADETADANSSTETVLVFVALPSQNVRLDEYTMSTAGARGDDYVDFLADTLVPTIDTAFRIRGDRTARGLVGSSLGGLISYWGALRHPATFGYAAGMSSTFWWGDDFVLNQLSALGCQNVVYYLDSGSPDDNYDVTLSMRDTLAGLGCPHTYVLKPGGLHDWAFWRERFGGVLADFASVHGG